MPTITKKTIDTIQQQKETNELLNFFSNALLKYKPEDYSIQKENLLTLYVNNTNLIDSHLLMKFKDKNFYLQIDKINNNKWDLIIESLKNDFSLHLMKNFFKDNLDYFKIPTKHIHIIFDSLNDDTHTIIDTKPYFFTYSNFINEEQIVKYMKNTEQILFSLCETNKINETSISSLTDVQMIEQIKNNIENPLKFFYENKNMKHNLVYGKYMEEPFLFDSLQYLSKLKIELFNHLLNKKLNKQTNNLKSLKI